MLPAFIGEILKLLSSLSPFVLMGFGIILFIFAGVAKWVIRLIGVRGVYIRTADVTSYGLGESMEDKGIGVISALLVIAVTVGVGVPTSCVVVDTVDVDSDHPLYFMERWGEGIKERFIGGRDWERDRADERLAEFLSMQEKGKGADFKDLIEDYADHIGKLENLTLEDVYNLVMAMIDKHSEVLENLLTVVPPEAKPAIELALERKGRLENLLENRFPAAYENYRQHLTDIMEEYREWHEQKPWRR